MTVERSNRSLPSSTQGEPARPVDDMIDIRTQNAMTTLVIEARRSVSPRDTEQMIPAQVRALASMAGVRFLVVAPWLSPRTRELLANSGVNYVDLTGNTLIRLENPPLYIRTDGATRDPAPAKRGIARLRGPKAGRLVRLLADVRPPYGVRQLAAVAGLAPGYVSRLLDALDREAIVERNDRGRIDAVDFVRLLRRYAETYDTFDTNQSTLFVARAGAATTLKQIASTPLTTAITGSFAATRIAPIAAPALLAVYCTDIAGTARALDLLPAVEGANVTLLRPFDPVVWSGTTTDGGASYVAPTQIALDCLAGNGRMPAEGEAMLSWLTDNESTWRAPSLTAIAPIAGGRT
jgi:hypothetical protein